MTARRLSELVTVRGRFHRSVSLTRDWKGAKDLSEYIVTPAICSIAEQILDELKQPQGARSWSLTGPYGTGKSAFALFLADLLASDRPAHQHGRELRTKYLRHRKPMLPILLQSERAPLIPVLLEALATEAASLSRPIVTRARKLLDSGVTSGEAIAELLVDIAGSAAKKGRSGVAIFVDEFGKYLEFSSSNPGREDIFVLQQIAEAAARSEVPILFVTILHTGFADYLAQGDEARRAEWQKVQGRFRDIPFQLPGEQLLGLVAHALETKLSNGVGAAYRRRLDVLLESDALSEALARGRIRELLSVCLPLHPVVALILWPLFRSKVAQNERSLFAFLTSHEPHGFQEFLLHSSVSDADVPLYELPELYDYVASSLGLAAFAGADSRRWALIDHALHRIPASAPPLTRRVVKAIGLLAQYGTAAGLYPTEQLLRATLDRWEGLDEALGILKAESIIIYRRHTNSFGLWEGSDVDLDAMFSDARARVPRQPISERLERALDLRPQVARAHYVQTGTLRYFEPRISSCDSRAIDRALSATCQADGRTLFIVGGGSEASSSGREWSRLASGAHVVLVAIPRVGTEILGALEEFECWQWARDHATELTGDPVARQEVQARLEASRARLEHVAGPVFGLSGYPLDPMLSDWFFRGSQQHPRSARDFQSLLSAICEEVFSQAPPLRNELLNRHNLSSAAAKARRILLERMVEHPHQPRLAIEGFPPEYSMYEAFLVEGGFHGSRAAEKGLHAPTNPKWKPVWMAVERFLAESTEARRPLSDLISVLQRPPFGVRQGPIPALIAAALLVKGHEVALYEDGVFVPEVSIEVLERLSRRPETFELRSYRLTRVERQALVALTKVVHSEGGGDDALLAIVRALIRLAAGLPAYARQTRRLDPRTCAVRDVLLSATDPKSLLFDELPSALGVDITRRGAPAEFARDLRQATIELARAYPTLLNGIEEAIRSCFGVASKGTSAREELRRRAAPLVPFATDPRLQVFVREAAKPDERDWREILGRAAADGKPPAYWRDDDATALRLKLQAIALEFDRLEELVAAAGGTPAVVVSVSVLEGGAGEQRSVISCPAEQDPGVEDLIARIDALLLERRVLDERGKLIALASVVRKLAAGIEKSREVGE